MGKHRSTLTINCKNCGNPFTAPAYYITSGRRVYCSRTCYNTTRPSGFKLTNKTDYERKLESVRRHPQRNKCRVRFEYAVKAGQLEPRPCIFCGSHKSEGHHWDYSRPYDVFWLCRQHHVDVHKLRITLLLPAKPKIAAVDPHPKLHCRPRPVQLGNVRVD